MGDNVCKNKAMALSLLGALCDHTKAGPRRAALQSVMSWIEDTVNEIPDDPEERERLIDEIEAQLRDCMTETEFREIIRHYCKIPPDRDFNIVILPPGSDVMLRKEGEDYVSE